jgi:large subunit ribosomal protein L21e
MAHKHYQGKHGIAYNVTKSSVYITANKQVKANVLAKITNVYTELTKHFNSQDSFLKYVKENDQKLKEAKKTGTRIEVKCQRSTVRTNGKEPE